MELVKVPLQERADAAREGRTAQPEYLPCLVQEWAKMPIQAYFGSCRAELLQLYDLLGFAPEENPSYQAVALRIFNDYAASSENAQEEARLLAAPIRREWARDDWRGEEHA